MNRYPSWIHRIPEMIETLALATLRAHRPAPGRKLFGLRRSATHELLRRLGAERYGNSLVIGRGHLMARLREAQEHPDWRWESDRCQHIRKRIDQLRPASRKSLVPVSAELRGRMEALPFAGLPETVCWKPGRLVIVCRDMEDLLQQLVLIAKALDTDYEFIRMRIEQPSRKQPGAHLKSGSDAAQQAS